MKKSDRSASAWNFKFLCLTFFGTFVTATVVLTMFAMFVINGSMAEAMSRCTSYVADLHKSLKGPVYQEKTLYLMNEINKLHSSVLACDERFERNMRAYEKDEITADGLVFMMRSNDEQLIKLYEQAKKLNIPNDIPDDDKSVLNSVKDILLKRIDHDERRQQHYRKLLQDKSAGKIDSYNLLYLEDVVMLMQKIKQLEDKYQLVYINGQYQQLTAELVDTRQNLQWALLIRKGKNAQEKENFAEAENIYKATENLGGVNAKGAALVSLALLKREQGDFQSYGRLLDEAEKFWPGVRNGRGEYAACRQQGLI